VPVLKQAGFRRRGREFILDGPSGPLGAVGFYPNALPESMGFFLQYGIVTPAMLEMSVENGVPIPKWLSPSEALLMVQVFAPSHQRDWLSPYRWRMGDEAHIEHLGKELHSVLTGEVIPNIRLWFDPKELAGAMEPHRPGRFPRMAPPTRAPAMALLEAGPSEDLDRALARLADDDPVRRWIEARLAPA
jgi:hypothetical protein